MGAKIGTVRIMMEIESMIIPSSIQIDDHQRRSRPRFQVRMSTRMPWMELPSPLIASVRA